MTGDLIDTHAHLDDEQFQTEIPRKPILRKITIHCGRCQNCGKLHRGRHPFQTSDATGAAQELATLARQRSFIVKYVVGPEIGNDETDRLGIAALRSLVPDIAERDVFVCGPPGMVDAVCRRLRALHVPRARVHYERFAY